ncbi:MAG: CoA-binding protein [Desulfohalobiaceae bacterium]|nr:CoA-binding protein [Desulfohalobiaceae bacterium]
MQTEYSESFQGRLRSMLSPQTVAVVGASNNTEKLGYHVMKSLFRGGFPGRIIPVNPGSDSVLGLPAFQSLSACEQPVDLVIVVVPSGLVLSVLQEAADLDVRGLVLITAGFKEIDDPAGEKLQSTARELARSKGLPVIGPNTFGAVNLRAGLNATFTPEFSNLKAGDISLVSQSGGIAHLLAFLAENQGVGMGKVIGLGNRLTVDFADMVRYLADDPETSVIAMYLEGVDNPRSLIAAAGEVRGRKPIIAYKAGDSGGGDQVSRSHTGSLAGNKALYQGAFRQAGIHPARSSQELLDLARTFRVCPRLGGPRIAVLSGQAGPNMTALDVLEAEGLTLAQFGRSTRKKIHELLPPLALRDNPVDMGPAWYSTEAVQGIVGAVLEDSGVDGILVLTMYASANREVLPGLTDFFLNWGQKKPLITCFLSPKGIWDEPLAALEEQKGIVNLPTPEQAAQAMAGLWKHSLS